MQVSTDGNIMAGKQFNSNEFQTKDGYSGYAYLRKDRKIICRTECINAPAHFSNDWSILDIKPSMHYNMTGLPRFYLQPAFENEAQNKEWGKFTSHLQMHNRVAVVHLGAFKCYILPPDYGTNFHYAVVLYTEGKSQSMANDRKHGASDNYDRALTAKKEETGDSFDTRSANTNMANDLSRQTCPQAVMEHLISAPIDGAQRRSLGTLPKQENFVNKNYVRADPSYLKTLGQTHSGWVFGAVAELVDNSRDAKATKLQICIQTCYSKKDGTTIPMLSVIDDGHGMSHQDIMVMLSFGHKQPDSVDRDHIGRFGIGFKTGAMRLGRDVVVLTQTSESRSIAFLSQSLNEGKDNLEIPIVSFCRRGSFMEVDKNIQSEDAAAYHLNAIKEFSPFNEYFIGEKSGLFGENGTGTQIYIWNLDRWGSDFALEWQNRTNNKSPSDEDDILIRSRRIRSRPGQVSQKVPLDYSLRSYLEVIFSDPRMKIYVQGSLVKSRPLAKSLNKTVCINDEILGKPVQLTLGRCQLEWERSNSGIFLYWHGRLIEAYKRVGGMVHNADMGRGVIGVIDVTDLMSDGNDVLVHNTKQAFLDCEAYAKLEEWLGHKSDEYWDAHFDTLELKRNSTRLKPDHEWVQCDKCRKWRVLNSNFDSATLPQEWFCYMPPFNGKCEMPQEEEEPGVVTVGAKRSAPDQKQKPAVAAAQKVHSECVVKDDSEEVEEVEESSQTFEDAAGRPTSRKRLKKGPAAKSSPNICNDKKTPDRPGNEGERTSLANVAGSVKLSPSGTPRVGGSCIEEDGLGTSGNPRAPCMSKPTITSAPSRIIKLPVINSGFSLANDDGEKGNLGSVEGASCQGVSKNCGTTGGSASSKRRGGDGRHNTSNRGGGWGGRRGRGRGGARQQVGSHGCGSQNEAEDQWGHSSPAASHGSDQGRRHSSPAASHRPEGWGGASQVRTSRRREGWDRGSPAGVGRQVADQGWGGACQVDTSQRLIAEGWYNASSTGVSSQGAQGWGDAIPPTVGTSQRVSQRLKGRLSSPGWNDWN